MIESIGQAGRADSLNGDTPGALTMTNPDFNERAELEPLGELHARVRLANGPLLGPVLWRLVSMMLTRADWPLDRLDEAQLVCDALSAHAFAHTDDAIVTFDVQASECEAQLRVLDLTDDGARGLVADAMLPLVGNVLERISERVSVEPAASGVGSQLALVLRARSS
jgi:hypothetical protein